MDGWIYAFYGVSVCLCDLIPVPLLFWQRDTCISAAYVVVRCPSGGCHVRPLCRNE